MQIILPELPSDFNLNITLEYSQNEETVTMQVKYTGKVFNLKDSDNMLSLKFAENAAQSIEYSEIDEDGFTNLVVAKIK